MVLYSPSFQFSLISILYIVLFNRDGETDTHAKSSGWQGYLKLEHNKTQNRGNLTLSRNISQTCECISQTNEDRGRHNFVLRCL